MAKKLAVFLMSFVIGALTSCTTISPITRNQSITLVKLPDPNRIRFTGKGAGAGVMLMSSMGPMGIAVGVAIDEGIAKDIQKNLDTTGESFNGIVEKAVAKSWGMDVVFVENAATDQNEAKPLYTRKLTIKKYGFKTVPGDDLVSPFVEAEVMCKAGGDEKETMPVIDAAPYSASLEAVKTDGLLVQRLLTEYLHAAVSQTCISQ